MQTVLLICRIRPSPHRQADYREPWCSEPFRGRTNSEATWTEVNKHPVHIQNDSRRSVQQLAERKLEEIKIL